jgi:hypothetical protein
MDTYHRWMEVTLYATFAGLPAISVPAGFHPNGRWPGGLQLIGRPRGDAELLRIATAYECSIGELTVRRREAPARRAALRDCIQSNRPDGSQSTDSRHSQPLQSDVAGLLETYPLLDGDTAQPYTRSCSKNASRAGGCSRGANEWSMRRLTTRLPDSRRMLYGPSIAQA